MLKSRHFICCSIGALLALILTSGAERAYALNLQFGQVALEIGYGEGITSTTLTRLGLQWRVQPSLAHVGEFELALMPLFSSGFWRGDRDITDIAATPVIRLQRNTAHSFRPYVEGAIGFHYISDIQMRSRVFSTNFQFGDHLGIGFQIGKDHALEFGYQFQHLSNASIKRPNAGINFHILRIGYSF